VSADVDVEALQRYTRDAIAYALDEDVEGCLRVILDIAEMGPVAVHAALVGWSTVSLSGFEEDQGKARPGDWWGLEVEDLQTGETVSADAVSDPATRDAARLITCVGNQDHDTIAAIIMAAEVDMEALVKLMFQSVKLAACIARSLYDSSGGQDGVS
jgi:hypothetical protein